MSNREWVEKLKEWYPELVFVFPYFSQGNDKAVIISRKIEADVECESYTVIEVSGKTSDEFKRRVGLVLEFLSDANVG